MRARVTRLALLLFICAAGVALAQGTPSDTDESAYAPSTLAKILGGTARSQNDEAELAGANDWYSTTATFTGRKRPPSGRYRPIISAWVSSHGQDPSTTEMYFGDELPELEFEQGGRKFWVMAGLPGGLGFGIYPPGQKLTIYLQRVGFASGTPVAMLTMAKLPGGVTSTTVPARGRVMHNTRMGEGERRQEATYKTGTATFTYAGREYSFALDVTGRHSVPPGMYSYANGVRTALLEFASDEANYLLLRAPVPEAGEQGSIVPYLVLNGRIVPPIDISACRVSTGHAGRESTDGSVDCGGVSRAVLSGLRYSAD